MSYKMIYSALKTSKDIINYYVKEGMLVIDCTMGNGGDTLLLADKIGVDGKVFAFDIQKIAIEETYNKLIDNKLIDRVNLILDSHENIDKYIKEEVDFIIYNLGYLPKGNKSITTKSKTTLKSIKKSLNILKENGLLIIVAYPGHISGLEEQREVEIFLKGLDQKEFNVFKGGFINQINNPPIIYIIEKSKINKV